jgi:hypothetical protein
MEKEFDEEESFKLKGKIYYIYSEREQKNFNQAVFESICME